MATASEVIELIGMKTECVVGREMKGNDS